MPNRGRHRRPQAAPEVKTNDPPNNKNNNSTAKDRVEQLFGGDAKEINTELANDAQPTRIIETHLEVTAEHEGKTAKAAKDAVDAVINALGTDKMPETLFPVTASRNNGQAAAQFVLWDHVNRRVGKILEAAAAQAEREGVFGDKEAYVEGETIMTFNSAEYSISVKKNNGSRVVDKELVEQVLREVAPSKWQELYDRCLKPRAGAAMRIVSLK